MQQSVQTLIKGCLLSENKPPQKRTTYKIIFLIHLIVWVYWDWEVKKFKRDKLSYHNVSKAKLQIHAYKRSESEATKWGKAYTSINLLEALNAC